MGPGSHLLVPRSWLRLPARTAHLRLTLLYGGLFLFCGAVLLTITYLLSEDAIDDTASRIPASSGVPSLVPVHPAEPRPGSPAAASLAATDRELVAQRASDLHHLLINSGIACALVALLALMLGWYVAGRVLRPVRTIAATARRISATNLHERLALAGPDDEFKALGDTLDDLLERLQTAFEAQQRFVASASHELRTPLAWEQMLLQVALADPNASTAALREACEKVLVASKQQQGLVEALLALATSERELDHHEPIDLATLVDAATLNAWRHAEERAIEVTAVLEPALACGHPALVERLVANLIDNAIRYNERGGHVHLETGTTADLRARLFVTNSGPKIPPAEIERLFEPFQRLKTGRSNAHANGYGLGLSIIHAIATAHHAQLTAQPRPEGGLAIEVILPAATATIPPADLAHEKPHAGPKGGHLSARSR
jgi:signal transduction histidine kinase